MNDEENRSSPAPAQKTSSGDNIVLRTREVRKRYVIGKRQLTVLNGIGMEVGEGEFLALKGASGAGKSTLLHLLGGLDVPSEGSIWFQERNLSRLSSKALCHWRNRSVGFVFQAYHLLPELTALENVSLPARMQRKPPREAAGLAEELLARVGLKDRLEHRPFELSGGEQQRVAIARALVNHPELILADEPTGNLDSRTGSAIIELLETLRKEQGATLLIATHDEQLAHHAPRVLELVDGRIESDTRLK